MADDRYPVFWIVIVLVGLVIAAAWISEVAGNDHIFPAELGDMKLISDESGNDTLVGTSLDTINTSKRYAATYMGRNGILTVNIAEMESQHVAYTALEELKLQVEVTAENDGDSEGPHISIVTHTAASNDGDHDGAVTELTVALTED